MNLKYSRGNLVYRFNVDKLTISSHLSIQFSIQKSRNYVSSPDQLTQRKIDLDEFINSE